MGAEPVLSGGNTAWVIIATALVMFMTVPALGLFYGGLVRKKNVLSVLMQCFITLALVSVLWIAFGYSLAFSGGELIPGVLGDFKWAFLRGITPDQLSPYYVADAAGRIPHLSFVMFQCMFAVITPALIVGAFAERMKFSSFLVFTALWEILIYSPLAHMVWSSNGWLFKLGVLDFAGGTVVHINAGFAALAAALVIGRRNNLKALPPHNLPYTLIGAAMLWFGWFGFNAGSALAANGIAASAFMTTNLAAAAAALTWPVLDMLVNKRPTILGAATGAVVGLVAITPAAGYVNAGGAFAIGAIASAVCFVMVTVVKERFGYDDALDAFGCHGVGGLVGALLTGVFADPALWKAFGASYAGALYGNPRQLLLQLIGSGVSIAIAFLGTLALLKVIDLAIGLRVDAKAEAIGLDISQHHERAYTVLE
jgi:ammonium transporter, Amt family